MFNDIHDLGLYLELACGCVKYIYIIKYTFLFREKIIKRQTERLGDIFSPIVVHRQVLLAHIS